MNRRSTLVIVTLTGLLAIAPLPAQDGETAEMDAAMQAFIEAGMPGEHHDHLQKLVGDWTYAAKFWMPGSDGPMTTEGAMTATSLLGGRFVQYVYTGEMMGRSFTGIGIDGYDNDGEEYTSVWFDNMGTQMYTYRGSCGDSGKTRTMSGTYVDPMMGVEVTDRSVMTFNDDGSVTMESYREMPGGDEVKQMEMLLKRE